MNIQQLRQSLKLKWLSYYERNRSWLVKIQVWATYDGLRRPSSGFIVATLSVLEPQFEQLLSFILDLSNNPDKIVAALGLNFNPDEELRLIKSEHSLPATQVESESPQEKCLESNAVPSVATATKVAPQSPVKTLQTPKLFFDLPRAHQSVPSFTATTEVARTPEPVPLVAVATKIIPDLPGKTSNSAKLPSSLLRQNKPMRSPQARLPVGASLVITTEVPSKGNHMRSPLGQLPSGASLVITTDVKSKNQTLLSSALTTEIPSNSNHVSIQPQDVTRKVNLSPRSNAGSLASWVDEFCQGTEWEREDSIFI